MFQYIKCLFLIVCLVISVNTSSAQTFSDAQIEVILKAYGDCSKAANLDVDILKRARNNDFVEDDGLKKYYACMFQALNWMDDKGSFKVDNIKSFLHMDGDAAKWNDIVEHCFEKAENNNFGLVAYHAVICFTDKVGGKINL